MASGKKGKKTKGKTIALTAFLQDTSGSIPVQPIRKSNNWADEVEDYDGFETRKPVNVVLPTAPKASRDYDDNTDKVPLEPPFCAYLSNLPYDVEEDEIADFFRNMQIANMRIPKDDRSGEGLKSKGYGYVEFEDRDSLLNALDLRDTTLKNRRIRIEVAANAENDRRRSRMEMGRDRGERSETFGDWRSGPRTETNDNDRRGGYNKDREGGGGGFNRDNMRGGDREERSFSRDNMRDRDSGFGRDRDNRDSYRSNRDREGQDDKPGGWRDGDRANRDQDRDRGFTRDRGNFRDSDRSGRYDDRDDRRGFGGRRFDNDRDRNDGFSRGGGRDDRDRNEGFARGGGRDDRDRNESFTRGSSDRDSEPVSSEPRERPKLMLAPRTKPVENVPVKTESVPTASIFGSAKPVDTSQREREIEEKLAKEQSEKSRDVSRDRKTNVPEDSERKTVDKIRPSRRIEDISQKDSDIKEGPPPPRKYSPHKDIKDDPPARRNSSHTDNKDEQLPPRDKRDGPPPRKNSPQRDSLPPKRNYENKKGLPRSEYKSPDKTDNRHKSEKPRRDEKREKHDKEMPKFTEPEAPNFAANNKFAFLQDQNSD